MQLLRIFVSFTHHLKLLSKVTTTSPSYMRGQRPFLASYNNGKLGHTVHKTGKGTKNQCAIISGYDTLILALLATNYTCGLTLAFLTFLKLHILLFLIEEHKELHYTCPDQLNQHPLMVLPTYPLRLCSFAAPNLCPCCFLQHSTKHQNTTAVLKNFPYPCL